VLSSTATIDLRRRVRAGTATSITQTDQAANHQRVIDERRRNVDEPIEFLI